MHVEAAASRRVYPRVGGETEHLAGRDRGVDGLSPRGRGNRGWPAGRCGCQRSIPAWAGKPLGDYLPSFFRSVYPRVGGETRASSGSRSRRRGLSPRGRGNRRRSRRLIGHRGSIPAWAGKPVPRPVIVNAGGVYPRVGGETPDLRTVAGESCGLSPRGRGNRLRQEHVAALRGSIPAWAGKPGRPGRRGRDRRVYPRVGGETYKRRALEACAAGLSPRGRGNHKSTDKSTVRSRSIPAWAGKPAWPARRPGISMVYPRVGGETTNRV